MGANALLDVKRVEAVDLDELVEIAPAGTISRILLNHGSIQQTLFGMDAGQTIRTHSTPHAATVQVLSGRLKLRVNDEDFVLCANQLVMMPAGAPHALDAVEPTRFLLTIVRDS